MGDRETNEKLDEIIKRLKNLESKVDDIERHMA